MKRGHRLHRKATKLCGEQFELRFASPNADLCVFLFDDNKMHCEECIGRIVVPVQQLVAPPLLNSPKGAVTSWYWFAPPSREDSNWGVQSVYHEAVSKVKGSGMVQPTKPIGFLLMEIELQLHDSGLLWTAGVNVVRCQEDDEESEDEQDVSDIRTIRLMIQRLKRLCSEPPLLKFPCSLALVPVHVLSCIFLELHYFPVLLWLLVLINGILLRFNQEDRMSKLIFWERSLMCWSYCHLLPAVCSYTLNSFMLCHRLSLLCLTVR